MNYIIPAQSICSTSNGSITFHLPSINVENTETKDSSNSPYINMQRLGRFLKNPWGICGKILLTTKPFLEYFLLSGSGGFLVVTWPWRKCVALFPCSGTTSHGDGHSPPADLWGMVTQTSWLLASNVFDQFLKEENPREWRPSRRSQGEKGKDSFNKVDRGNSFAALQSI